MSRMATNEYIGAKRRLYATADREKRIKMLDEVCETTGYERKYANRLLTGSRKSRERKGRGKTYGEEVAVVLKKVRSIPDGRILSVMRAGSVFIPQRSFVSSHVNSRSSSGTSSMAAISTPRS